MGSKIKAKKGFPYFYVILGAVLLVGIIAEAIALNQLKGFLADYEHSLSKYVADEVYEEYFMHPDYEKLIEISGCEISPAESKEALAEYIKNEVGGEQLVYKTVSDGIAIDTVKYNVRAGSKKIAEFTLKKTGEKSRYGNDLFALDTIKLVYKVPSLSVSVKAPADCTVKINGYTLGAEQVVATEKTSSCDHMPEGVAGLTYNTYTLTGLINEPEVTVTDRNGKANVVEKEDDGVYSAKLNYSEELASAYREQISDAAQKYAAYMQSDGRFSAFSQYFDPDSTLYTQIKNAEIYFVWPHDGYSIEDVNVRDFYAYDDNTFSCRVSLTHVLHKKGSEDYRDYIDMTFYLRNVNGSYLIYDRENH